jgi:mannosyltransferase OCH1-like enzyme
MRIALFVALVSAYLVHGGGGAEEEAALTSPPKLAFTANIEADTVGGSTTETLLPTIFQGVSDKSTAETIRLRSGPLLTLFPGEEIIENDKNSDEKNHHYARHVVLDPNEQRSFLADSGTTACHHANIVERFDQLQSASLPNIASELWKYCALYLEGGIYVDAETAPLAALGDVLLASSDSKNGKIKSRYYAVVVDSPDAAVSLQFWPSSSITTSDVAQEEGGNNNNISSSSSWWSKRSDVKGKQVVSGSFISIPTKFHSVPKAIIDTIMSTPINILEQDALLLPKTLMTAIQNDISAEKEGTDVDSDSSWTFLSQRCHGIQIAAGDNDDDDDKQHRSLRHCPSSLGYCCEILDPQRSFVFLLSRHPIVPNQLLPHPSSLPQPYTKTISNDIELDSSTLSELPFISTLSDDKSSPLLTLPFHPGSTETTPNVFDLLSARNALPSQEEYDRSCMDCLRIKDGANCHTCANVCPNFCTHLCAVKLKDKPVKNVLSISGPRFKKDPERIIPRIIHQTWFEPVTPEKYPNMSRLIESWKRSGWEYNFYDDDSAGEFLSLHFPPEVRDAYDAVIPGAFKADLFRYCVLLIKGGVYSDMDVMLESNLDAAVPPDIGFMVPVDEPGSKPGFRMCLWNGMMAAAPAHPFLARAIDRIVHNIRNRFTVVDYDQIMCNNPTDKDKPELSVPHAFSTLFTAGPCILGMTVNEVLGRPLQQTFEHGELKTDVQVPGRTVILKQNKWDMGAHRFTWADNNLVVAATDMPDYDDRKDLKGEDKDQAKHYSQTLDRMNLYGYVKVYVDRETAHERVMFQVQTHPADESV